MKIRNDKCEKCGEVKDYNLGGWCQDCILEEEEEREKREDMKAYLEWKEEQEAEQEEYLALVMP